MPKRSPTARTLAALRSRADLIAAESVERWIPGTSIRKDLFGFADVVAVFTDGTVLLIQVTSKTNRASRRTKLFENSIARELVGLRRTLVQVWSWGPKTGELIVDLMTRDESAVVSWREIRNEALALPALQTC